MRYIIRFKAQEKPKKFPTLEEKRRQEREALFQMYREYIDFKDESQHHRFFFEFSGGYRNDLRKQFFEKQGGICALCKRPMVLDDEEGNFSNHKRLASFDHIIAIFNGGTHEKDNLQLACRGCNSLKSDKSVEEWNVRKQSTRTREQEYAEKMAFITPELKAKAVEILKQTTDGTIPDDIHIQLFGEKEHARRDWKLILRALDNDGIVEITRRGTGTKYPKDHPEYQCTLIKVNECTEELKSTTKQLVNS